MPAIQKRVATTEQDFPELKKSRKAEVEESLVLDPVQTKVASITTALQDEALQVPGPKSCREMLIAMAPSILATPRDQRHEQMESVVQSFSEIFAEEETRHQSKIAESEMKVAEASSELASRNAEAVSASSELQVKVDELKDKQAALAAIVGVTQNAEATLKDLRFELSHLEETKTDLAQEQEAAQSIMETFNMFKDSTQEIQFPKEEHNLLKTIGTFLKKSKADVSLVAAVPMALGRKGTERSEFDAMVVVEMEKKLDEKLHAIAAQVQSNTALIAEKTNSKATWETELMDSKGKQRAAAEAMLAVKAEQKQLVANLSTKKESVIEQEFEIKALEGQHDESLGGLRAHQQVQNTLIELIDRVAPVEPVAEVETVAEVVSEMPVDDVTPMEGTEDVAK
jgi:hypothetical protein